MKRIVLCVPWIAIAVCSVSFAEPRVNRIGTTIEEKPAISLVGYFFASRGGGYGPACGCDVAAPSCGIEASCAAEPSCGCGGDAWGGYCAPRCRKHFGLFHRHRGCCGVPDVTCGCEATCAATPSCGYEATCAAAPACGCDVAPDCGCGHRHWFHRCGNWGGCNYGCGHRCGRHCGKIRFWANGWCGEVLDGCCTGNPPACGADVMPGKALPPEPMPMDEPPPPQKSTRLPLLPGLSKLPIGAGLR